MTPVHLLVLIHGLWGNPSHLDELARIARETHSEPTAEGVEFKVLSCKSNSNSCTYDGIDWGGERLAEEACSPVLDEVLKLDAEGHSVTKFSIAGYSLGGLLARYVIGVLHQRKFFDKVEPMNFNTMATPHLGLPMWDGTFFAHVSNSLGPILLARTGQQFYGVDKYSASGRPLLEVMADSNLVFYQALCLFRNKTFYANAVNDTTVPYITSAMDTWDPFAEHLTNGIEIEFNEKYPALVSSWSFTENKKTEVKKVDKRPSLPPFLTFPFPFPLNYVFYSLLPILIPVGIIVALTKFGIEGTSSRARIRKLTKQLHKDTSKSRKLIAILAEMENEVERTVLDMVDSDHSSSQSDVSSPSAGLGPFLASSGISSSFSSTSGSSTPSDIDIEGREIRKIANRGSTKKSQPALTSLQKKLGEMMNTIPGLNKQLAFFPSARNSHAVIVSRDVRRFPHHKEGESVIRHWADHMVL